MPLTKVNNHDPRRRKAHPCRQAAWVGGGGIYCADDWITDFEELFMKTVIEMAQESTLMDSRDDWGSVPIEYAAAINAFADLVRADEREACAKVCDDWPNGRDDVYSIGEAIRARGQA